MRVYIHKLFFCGIAGTTSAISCSVNYPVQMRIAPVLSLYNILDSLNKVRKTADNTEVTITTPTFLSNSTFGYLFMYDNGGTPLTAGTSYDGYIRANARL